MTTWEEYRALKGLNGSVLVHGLDSMHALKKAMLRKEDESSDKMTLGSVAHVLLFEPDYLDERFAVLPDFKNDSHNVDAKGNKSTSANTKWVKEQTKLFVEENAGRDIVKAYDLETAKEMILALRRKKVVEMWLTASQKEVTLAGEIEGELVKGRVDMLNMSAICDLKTTGNISPRLFGATVARMRYAFKMSIYRELARQSGFRNLAVYLIAVEQDRDPDVAVYTVPDEYLDRAFENVVRVIKQYKAAARSGVWPGVDGGEDYLPLAIPNWDMPDDEVLEFQG